MHEVRRLDAVHDVAVEVRVPEVQADADIQSVEIVLDKVYKRSGS